MQDQALKYHGILRRMDIKERVRLVESLVHGEADEDQVHILADLLDDESYELRVAAYRKLTDLGHKALPVIRTLALEGSTDQRFWCVKLLRGVGRDAASALEGCIHEEDSVILGQVLEGLGELRQDSSIPFLFPLLTSCSYRIRNLAFQALKKYGDKIYKDLEEMVQSDDEDLFFWSVRLLGAMGHRAHALLHKLLKEADAERRFLLAAALGESGDSRVIRLLVQSLGDKPALISRRANEALIQIGKASIRPVLEALRDVQPQSVRWYFFTLCSLGEEGMEELSIWLEGRSELWLWDARDEFLFLGKHLPRLLTRLVEAKDRRLRFFAFSMALEKGLERFQEDVMDLAILGLRDSCWPIRKMCAEWLAEQGAEAVRRLSFRLASAQEDEFFWLLDIFKKSPKGRELLAERLDPSERMRASSIAQALQGAVPSQAVDPLVQCLRSEHWIVRKSASEALASAGKASLRRVVQALISPHEEQVFWLGRALKSYGRDVWPHLLALLHEPEFPGWLAAKAIGILREPYFLAGLREALKENDSLLVLHACHAHSLIDSQQFLPAVLGLLSQLDVEEHEEFLSLLDKAPAPERNEHILSGLKSRQETLVHNSIVLSARYHLEDARSDLMAFLKRGEYVMRTALSLAELGVQEAAPWLRKAMGVENRMEVRLIFMQALCRLSGEDMVETLLKVGLSAEDERKKALSDAEILRMGLIAVTRLAELLGHQDPMLRGESARILRLFGPLALPSLKALLDDSLDQRRLFASKLYKEIRGEQA